ncbi:hypothetical protein [Hyalangium gracile]|uniref:hypothetical protein n=1 Tax=Hyalangium gracile TaxID=394092 RepID=UPI001CCCBD64|nr:hypothetical protein [Hyalangium gracile]
MSVMRQWVSLPVLLLCACGSSELPLPTLVSVEPASIPADSRFLLTLEFEGVLPVKVDYGSNGAELIATERVRIADKEFDVIQAQKSGRQLTVDVIPWLAVGAQDVKVQLQDGRQVVLEQGLQVNPPLNLTGFEIDPIGEQIRHRPFMVTIRALGPDAALFNGRVIVRSTQGNVDPKVSDAFKNGELKQRFTGDDSTESSMKLIVEDYAGHTGMSNEFILGKP